MSVTSPTMETIKFETIKYEKEDGFVTLTLNRPERLNALNRQMQIERNLAFREILRDPEVKAFIITGAPRPDAAEGQKPLRGRCARGTSWVSRPVQHAEGSRRVAAGPGRYRPVEAEVPQELA